MEAATRRPLARAGLVAAMAAFVLTLVAGPASAQSPRASLADAAKRQDWAAAAALLRAGADVGRRHGDGTTALHWAVYWDDAPTVRRLLAAGAAADAANDLGATPLWLAASNGSAALLETLLAAGADPDQALPSGETPLMTAARTGNPAAVQALLDHGADPHATEHTYGQTALMWAVAQRHAEVVRVLLASGARVDARSRAYPQVVSSSGNADPSGVFEVLQGGYTPLLFAARHGDVASARLLIAAGAAVDEAAASGTTPLVVAAHGNHRELATFLLEAGADPNAAGAGYSALHAAVLRGDPQLAAALLRFGADPDAVLERGTPARRVSADWRLPHRMIGATPFWVAASFREPAIMRLLAEQGADPAAARSTARPPRWPRFSAAARGGGSASRAPRPTSSSAAPSMRWTPRSTPASTSTRAARAARQPCTWRCRAALTRSSRCWPSAAPSWMRGTSGARRRWTSRWPRATRPAAPPNSSASSGRRPGTARR